VVDFAIRHAESSCYDIKLRIWYKHKNRLTAYSVPPSKASAVYYKITLIFPSLSLSSNFSIFCNVAKSQLVVFTDDWSHCCRPIFKNQDAQEEEGHDP